MTEETGKGPTRRDILASVGGGAVTALVDRTFLRGSKDKKVAQQPPEVVYVDVGREPLELLLPEGKVLETKTLTAKDRLVRAEDTPPSYKTDQGVDIAGSKTAMNLIETPSGERYAVLTIDPTDLGGEKFSHITFSHGGVKATYSDEDVRALMVKERSDRGAKDPSYPSLTLVFAEKPRNEIAPQKEYKNVISTGSPIPSHYGPGAGSTTISLETRPFNLGDYDPNPPGVIENVHMYVGDLSGAGPAPTPIPAGPGR